MTGTTKKILTAFLAVAAAVCLAFGLFLGIPKTAFAETGLITFSSAENSDYLNFDSTDSNNVKFAGLKDKSADATLKSLLSSNAKFKIVVPQTIVKGETTLNVSEIAGVESITGILKEYGKNLVSLELPQTIKKIGKNAFRSCTSLNEIVTSDALTDIGMGAFEGCTSLTEITIPQKVTTIGEKAFAGCSSVSTVNYLAKSSGTANNISPFSGIGLANVLIDGATSLPSGLFSKTNIAKVTFQNVDIPTAGGWAGQVFLECAKLKEVVFGNNCVIPKIGDYAFSGCSSLLKISLPNTVTKIGANAFKGCTSIIKFTVPEKITGSGIDAKAFDGCTNLLEVVNKSKLPINKGEELNGCVAKYAESVIKDEAESKFKNQDNFVFFATDTETTLIRYEGSNKTVALPLLDETYKVRKYIINNQAFAKNEVVEKVIFPTTQSSEEGVWKIGERAFWECASLNSIQISENVIEIGDNAFLNCVSLRSVTLPDKISYIGTQMFMGCASLESIKIPAGCVQIKVGAFENCVSLKTVNFTKNALFDNKYRTEEIANTAFKNCTSLETITINDKYDKRDVVFGNQVFDGCSKLKTVVIPEKASFNVNTFQNCSAYVVAPTKSAYDAYKADTTRFGYFNGKLTYSIKVNFDQVVVKAGADSTFTAQQVDSQSIYFGVPDQKLPNQKDYSKSVWYKTKTVNGETVTLSNKVGDPSELTEEVTLYAYCVEKPVINTTTAARTATYTGEDLLQNNIGAWFTASEDIGVAGSDKKYMPTVLKYKNMSDDVVENTTQVVHAGTYTLAVVINNPDDYGAWTNGIEVKATVLPKKDIEVSSIEWGIWDGTTTSALNPDTGKTSLYGYTEGGERYYLTKQTLGGVEQEPNETIEVAQSYVMWVNSKQWTIRLLNESADFIVGKVVYSTGNVGTAPGKYMAVAEIRLDNDHTFKLPDGNEPDDFKLHGISLGSKGADNCYYITKTWYIISSDANKLVSGNKTQLYSIQESWDYASDTVVLAAPELLFVGGERKDVQVDCTLLGYEYGSTLQDKPFAKHSFSLNDNEYANNDSKFKTYINNTMPAGVYDLTITVGNVVVEGQTYVGGMFSYRFVVNKANIFDRAVLKNQNITSDYLNGKVVKADYKGEGIRTIGVSKETDPILKLSEEDIHTGRKGVWYNSDYNKYYEAFTIRYSHEINGNLMTDAENNSKQPSSIGQYRIRYEISAPSYESISGQYDLVIMGPIDKPNAAALSAMKIVYTGKTLAYKIAGLTTDYFYPIFLNGERYLGQGADGYISKDTKDLSAKLNAAGLLVRENTYISDYTSAGDHWVALFLKNPSTNKWSELAGAKKIDGWGECAVLRFTIEKADNETLVRARIKSWEWGAYDIEENAATWTTLFDTPHSFSLRSKDNDTIKYQYDKDKGFADVPVGSYWLVPYAEKNENVNSFDTLTDDWVQVEITPANIQWKVVPYINSWTFGQDNLFKNPTYSFIDRQASLKDALNSYFCLSKEYGLKDAKTYRTLEEIKSKHGGNVPAGDWVYAFELPQSENYKDFSSLVHFSVVKASNYWDKTPVIHDFKFGAFEDTLVSLEIGVPHFRRDINSPLQMDELKLKSYGANGEETSAYIDVSDFIERYAVTVNGRRQLPVGKYGYQAKVVDDNNFAELKFESVFYVKKSENSWIDVPNVLGWSESNFKAECKPVAKSQFGSVYVTVKDSSGNVVNDLERVLLDELDTNLLRGLKVGNYTLVAEVAESSNGYYGGIKSEVVFAVYEDSVGLGGLIAATVVFTVIALALAGAGIFLLIRRNKKVEEEFRKFMKKEMRRG